MRHTRSACSAREGSNQVTAAPLTKVMNLHCFTMLSFRRAPDAELVGLRVASNLREYRMEPLSILPLTQDVGPEWVKPLEPPITGRCAVCRWLRVGVSGTPFSACSDNDHQTRRPREFGSHKPIVSCQSFNKR
jgi:hypothetical protein